MKTFFSILLCMFFLSVNIQAEEIIKKEIILNSPINFLKGNPVEIQPEEPLPVYGKLTGICFVVDDLLPLAETTKEQKKIIKNALIKSFKDKEIKDPYLPGPAFIEGFAIENKTKKSFFTNERIPTFKLLPEKAVFGKKTKNGPIEPIQEFGQLRVCSNLENKLSNVLKIYFTPLSSFQAKSVIWITSNVYEARQK